MHQLCDDMLVLVGQISSSLAPYFLLHISLQLLRCRDICIDINREREQLSEASFLIASLCVAAVLFLELGLFYYLVRSA